MGECSGENCPINSVTGHKDGSTYFDGNEKYINLGQQVNLADHSFSVLIWASRDSSGHSDPMLWQGPLSIANQRFLFGLDYNDRVVCGFGGSDLLTAEQYPGTGWHAYACTYDLDSGTRTIYRDGQAVASDNAAPVPVMQENLFIGSAPVGSFAGKLDELMVFDRALSDAEVREAYTGYQAVYHLAVEGNFLAGGDEVMDSSGYFQPGMLISGEGDLFNKVTAGQVGSYALHFDGNDRLAVQPAFSLQLERGSFTQSAWVRPTGAVAGGIISQYDENPEMRYPSIYMTASYGLTAGFGTFYAWNDFATVDNVLQPDAWNLVTARFDGSTYSLFVNGMQVASSDWLAGKVPYPAERFNIGDSFVGDIDDVQVFTRALSDEEILSLARAGWREADLAGDSSWSANVQGALEGSYRVDVRGWDAYNHFDTDWDVDHQWSGIVDTLAPRISLQRSMDADDPNLAHYSFEIRDRYLDESSVHQSLCDEIEVTREYFNSSWHLATGVPPNTSLYVLRGTCSGDIRTRFTTGLYACDTAGNCSMQEFPAYFTNAIFLPLVAGGAGPAAMSQPKPPLNAAAMERAAQWPLLSDSFAPMTSGQTLSVDILTGELTPASARSAFHTNLQGFISGHDDNTRLKLEILQNGELLYSTTPAVYAGLWNAVWFYPPGDIPANGIYTLRVTALNADGQQASAESEIDVHLLP